MSVAVAAAIRADPSLGHHPSSMSSMTIHNSNDKMMQANHSTTTTPRISDTSIIHLYNVPISTSDAYLLDLCRRWGPVQSIHKRAVHATDTTFPEVVIIFHDSEDAAEAMRHLHRGSLFNHALRAQLRSTILSNHLASLARPVSPLPHSAGSYSASPVTAPRNLYVLNLSLDMTNAELERLFSVFGDVTHVCIMAVLDHVGRRRAFVDMATSEAAQRAIGSLSGTTIHGYRVEVSFALIQRSGGPVTDYPPTAFKRIEQASIHLARNPQASASAFIRTQLAIENGFMPANPVVAPNGALVPWSPAASLSNLPPAFDAMSIPDRQLDLYIANLDPVAIVDDDDLYKLFKPYGSVIGARLGVDHNGYSTGTGVVRMSTPAEAERARTNIQGKVMDNKRLSVTFSPPPGSPFHPDYNASPANSAYATPALSMASSFGSTMSPQSPIVGYSLYPSASWSVSPTPYPYVNNLSSSFAGMGILSPKSYGAGSYAAYRMNQINRGRQPHSTQQFSQNQTHVPSNHPTSAFSHSLGSDILGSQGTYHSREDTQATMHSRQGSVETTGTSVRPGTASTGMDIKIEDASSKSGSGSLRSSIRSVESHDVFGPVPSQKVGYAAESLTFVSANQGNAQAAARKRCVTSDITLGHDKGLGRRTNDTAVIDGLSSEHSYHNGATPRPPRGDNRRKSMSSSI